MLFRIPFFPRPGNTGKLIEEAEEYVQNWEPGPEIHTEELDRMIANTVTEDILKPQYGYGERDRKAFRNTVYSGLRARKDLER